MNILYVAARHDPRDLNAGSGSDYQFYQSFLRMGANVKIIGPFKDDPSLLEKGYRKLHYLFSRRRYAKFSNRFLHTSKRELEQELVDFSPDVIFSRNIAPLVLCKTCIPIIYRFDTTLIGSHEQWPIFSELEYRRMLQWEKKVLRKTRLAVTHSEWSKNILIERYHFPAKKILVFPNPASLPEPIYKDPIQIPQNFSPPLHLLLVGKEHHRKGVDIAIRVAELLNKNGILSELHIIGQQGENHDHITYMGYFDKTDPLQLKAYLDQYRWAHLLLHPARFEAAGIVPAEAAIFGVPTITTSAGGLATTVQNGISGIVLPKDSSPELYVSAIKEFINDPNIYRTLCHSTRERYERELNWQTAGKTLQQAVEQLL
ncbi:MAG: glycosyltransferase family 4 protein [Anaerolineaceae bacterium]